MTARPRIVIGELSIVGDSISAARDSIEVWPGYGVACYPLGALNGSIPAVARGLVSRCSSQTQMRSELGDQTYSVVVILDGVDVSDQDVDAVSERLASLYKQHSSV